MIAVFGVLAAGSAAVLVLDKKGMLNPNNEAAYIEDFNEQYNS